MVDDSDSYAPVVMWSTIRFFIVFAMTMRWITISVDWVNAFPQAILDKPLFMQTPCGFLNKFGKDGCLKLTWSLYGSKLHQRIGMLVYAKHYSNSDYANVHTTNVSSVDLDY